MQRFLLILGSFMGMLCILLFTAQSTLEARVAPNGYGIEQEVEARKVVGGQQEPASCAAPDVTAGEQCRQLEAAILDVTLRLELTIKTLDDDGSGAPTSVSVGHATVVDGRFLVTHNHFAQSPDNQQASQLLTLSAYRADGTRAIHQAPAHTFQVLTAGPQTLVFDFGQYGGQDAFDYMGMASARLVTWQALGMRPGSEVAQVNWDGQKTSIDWVQVSSIGRENGVPALQLDNYVEPGASGGGIFYAGYHVGNNWFRDVDKQFVTGRTLRKFTAAALNDTALKTLTTELSEHATAAAASLPDGGALLNLASSNTVVR